LASPEFVKEVLDVRLPTFSRQTETADNAVAERPATGPATTPVRARRDDDATTETNLPSTVTPPPTNPPTVPRRSETQRAAAVDDTADLQPPAGRPRPVDQRDPADRDSSDRVSDDRDTTGRHSTDRHPTGPHPTDRESADLRPPATEPVVPTGPKPRSSMLATLGLIFGVASALLVLSGPLLGYGIGVAVLALVLSLAGIHATGKRHVAGKTDALIGMVLALGAIVVGVLALTGSLSWLGTDMHPVNTFRQWLDAQFVNRF
jgi:hypothetical protein